MAEFRMPSLGADMDEGTVIEWLVKPGDTVHKGDPVAVVDTDKAAIEVETFAGGTIDQILVPVGERVQVGTPLATINGTGPTPQPAPAPQRPATPAPVPARPAQGLPSEIQGGPPEFPVGNPPAQRAAPPATVTSVDRLKASPYARKLAHSLDVDLTAVPATGQRGMVTAEDVRRFAANPPRPSTQPSTKEPTTTPAPRHVVQQGSPRAAIARLMTRSTQEIPHYYLSTTVDLGTAIAWLSRTNRELPVAERLVPAALLLKATALAAQRHPELNGYWTEDAFRPADQVHLGVAISLRGGGLVAPALHDVASLPVHDVMARLRDLVERARAGRLRRAEMTEATITITNLGDQGVESVHGIIYPPQVALVGAGRIVERPWAVDGLLGVRPCLTLTLAADHRATDGFTGGRFLATVDRLLQTPEEL
ncbi:2-oxo acid dehydrogenase subunit E2 [Kribbella sindirgiensis]|uniref:Dihydrolipoamide acetyltransferase component of pyruvate dehydrogenase complex n=1 Tax=Kribbella sindirgiensis TaxID=1124744 RepID=A0A4V2M235_9ACTN|nr:2-oxo acid dehydrogenase subunit E2 [Kribbella sindirgiensis]